LRNKIKLSKELLISNRGKLTVKLLLMKKIIHIISYSKMAYYKAKCGNFMYFGTNLQKYGIAKFNIMSYYIE